jgi:hypothetical protein
VTATRQDQSWRRDSAVYSGLAEAWESTRPRPGLEVPVPDAPVGSPPATGLGFTRLVQIAVEAGLDRITIHSDRIETDWSTGKRVGRGLTDVLTPLDAGRDYADR